MAAACTEEDGQHQCGGKQYGETHARDGGDNHVDGGKPTFVVQPDKRYDNGQHRDKQHPPHHPPVARPGDGGGGRIGKAGFRSRHRFHLGAMHGIIKLRRRNGAQEMEAVDMTIAAIIENQGSVITVTADARVADVIALLAHRRIGAVPVMQGETVAGILSERDILYQLADVGASILDKSASEVMTSPVITATRDLPIMTALGLMTKRRIRHLPVVEEGRLAGIVSIGDLVKIRIDRIEAEALAMREYIQSA